MANFNLGGGTLKSTTLEAAAIEAALLLQNWERNGVDSSSSPPVTEPPITAPTPIPTYVTNSLFLDAPLPTTEGNENIKYNIGTQFKASVDGEIIALKFWKTSIDNTTSCVVNLWDTVTGLSVAEIIATYTPETVGWVTAAILIPFTIAANHEYCVTIQSKYYTFHSQGMLPNGTHIRDKLIAVKSVYNTFPGFPNLNFSVTENYYCDVIFRYLTYD